MVEAYLTSVVLPSAQGKMTLRNQQELKLLSKCIDHLLEGDFTRALDTMILRFQAVEMAHQDGHWEVAKHLVPIPDAAVSCTPSSVRNGLLRDERREVRSRALARSSRPT